MSDRTANLNLELPLGSKYWNYDTHNANMEKLDIASQKINRGAMPEFTASTVLCADGETTVQEAIDSLAHKNRRNLYSITLNTDREIPIGNYINVHCQVLVPANTAHSLNFIKSDPSGNNEFKIQGGRYYGSTEVILSDANTFPVDIRFKLGDVYYYKITQASSASNFYITEASDPFFNNITETHEYQISRTRVEYNYKDVMTIVSHQASHYGLEISAKVNSLNYGWSPFPLTPVSYDRMFNFNFQHLNCLWTSQRLY